MLRKGSNHGYKHMCPYCGGMHPASECPMMMYPPAMPMPSVPMPPMGGMPMGGMPMGGMPMGDMMGGMMGGMMEHMAEMEKLLHEIHRCCMENNAMIKEMHMKMAKG